MAKKAKATKTLRPRAAKKAKPAIGNPTEIEAVGDNPAAVFGRKLARLMKSARVLKVAELIAKSGVGETTIYGILRANLKSPPKVSTIRLLDGALDAGGKLIDCYADCVGKAAVGSWL